MPARAALIDPGRFPLQGFLPFAILIGIGYYILLFRSRFGFELRVSGMNPAAASSSRPIRRYVFAMFVTARS